MTNLLLNCITTTPNYIEGDTGKNQYFSESYLQLMNNITSKLPWYLKLWYKIKGLFKI
jgi:hypothetical protein